MNLSDWEGKENVGELNDGSCWCEVVMLLNYVDNPGVYIVKDTGAVLCLDHINATTLCGNEDILLVELANPTPYDAVVTVFCETTQQQARPMAANPWQQYEKVFVAGGGTARLHIIK